MMEVKLHTPFLWSSQTSCNFSLSYLLHMFFCITSSKAFLLCSLTPSVQISYPHVRVIFTIVKKSLSAGLSQNNVQGEYITVVHYWLIHRLVQDYCFLKQTMFWRSKNLKLITARGMAIKTAVMFQTIFHLFYNTQITNKYITHWCACSPYPRHFCKCLSKLWGPLWEEVSIMHSYAFNPYWCQLKNPGALLLQSDMQTSSLPIPLSGIPHSLI